MRTLRPGQLNISVKTRTKGGGGEGEEGGRTERDNPSLTSVLHCTEKTKWYDTEVILATASPSSQKIEVSEVVGHVVRPLDSTVLCLIVVIPQQYKILTVE